MWISGDIEPYELEDYLAEILSNEFDTIVDDGSLADVGWMSSLFVIYIFHLKTYKFHLLSMY